MSDSPVLGDVTRTLEEILVTEQQPPGLFEVSLRSPAIETISEGMGPRVNLYLFRIEENINAKNRDWAAVGTERQSYPPLALDLHYVLTPYAENQVDEHRVLGEALRILYDRSALEGEVLQGTLTQGEHRLSLDLCSFDIEEQTRIWNSFNQPYRLSVCYRVRVVEIESRTERAVRRVTEKVEEYVELGR